MLHTPDVDAAAESRHADASTAARSTYADLRAAAPTTLPDGPARTFRLPLQGDMARYVWMIDGQAYPQGRSAAHPRAAIASSSR